MLKYIFYTASQDFFLAAARLILDNFGVNFYTVGILIIIMYTIAINLIFSIGRGILHTGILGRYQQLLTDRVYNIIRLFVLYNIAFYCLTHPLRLVLNLAWGWWFFWTICWAFVLIWPILKLVNEIANLLNFKKHRYARFKRLLHIWCTKYTQYYTHILYLWDPNKYPSYMLSFTTIHMKIIYNSILRNLLMKIYKILQGADVLDAALFAYILRILLSRNAFDGNISLCERVAYSLSTVLGCIISILFYTALLYVLALLLVI